MKNLQIITPFNINASINDNAIIEADINRLKEIDHEIKVLSAEYKRIKDLLIDTHFKHSDQFVGHEGLVLATYKAQTRYSFQAADFKKDHQDVYELYCKQQTVNVFLLKK